MVEVYQNTPLFEVHKNLGAKIVPFAGWQMPVFYAGVLHEHKAVRERVGVFDVSHMGEIRVTGPQALSYLQKVTTNDVSRLKIGQGQYSLFCNHNGGVIDDLILYRIDEGTYFLCVNASNTPKDYQWLLENAKGVDVHVENQSSAWGQLAVQGPLALQALVNIFPQKIADQLQALPYTHILAFEWHGQQCLAARTGYTGEKGYEIYTPNAILATLWKDLFSKNEALGITPIGLGARDTLRLEACYPLYGQEMDDTVSPLEIGVDWAVKLEAKDFIGKEALMAQKRLGVKRKLVAFTLTEQAIPRSHMDIFVHNKAAGSVTSGSVLPTVGGSGGLALVAAELEEGQTIHVDVRGKHKAAIICKKPLYKARVKD